MEPGELNEQRAAVTRISLVKTARFTSVVQKAGDPEPHLVLTKPEQDAELKKAIKDHRIMTLFQQTVGQHADRGAVGFDPGVNRQFLIFPKSQIAFEGKQIVGRKYDLMRSKEIPKSQRATPPKQPKPKKQKAPKHEAKIEPAEVEPPRETKEESVVTLKKKVRHAMKVLEEGKAVVAFNLLKEIVEED